LKHSALQRPHRGRNRAREFSLMGVMEKGFMEEREKEGKNIYALTDKGQEYVNEFMRMKRFSESFGL